MGAYSITFSIFLLISGFFNVLLMEPMSIFGPTRHIDHFPTYMKRMGRNARAEFEAKYTAERNYEQLMAIYERAISDFG